MRRIASLLRSQSDHRRSGRARALKAGILLPLAAALALGAADSATAGVDGGRLVFLTFQTQFDHLDPARIYTGRDEAFTSSFLFRTLVSYKHASGANGTGLVADLATTTGESADAGKTWSFTLRDGSTFQDGATITCADVKYGVARGFAQNVITDGPQYAITYLDIPKNNDGTSQYPGPYTASADQQALFDSAVECSQDNRTITFHLAKARADFNEALAYVAYSPVQQSKDTADKYDTAPQSSGPYRISSYVPGDAIVLVRNSAWSAASDPVRQASPEQITVRFGVDQSVRDQIFTDDKYPNAVNFDGGMLPVAIRKYFADDTTASRRLNTFDPYVRYAAVNVKSLACPEVRQALFFAINTQALIDLSGGSEFYGVPGDNPVKPTIGLDYAETSGNIHDPAWSVTGNAAKAAALLAAAEAKGGECAAEMLRATDPARGLTWDIANSSTNQKAGALITDAMAAAGIKMNFNYISGGLYYSTVLNPSLQHDVSTAGWGADRANASTVIPELFTTAGALNLSQNGSDPAYAAFAEIVNQALGTTDRAAQSVLWKQASQYVMDQYWILRPVFSKTQYVWGSAVHDVRAWDAWGSLDFGAMTVDPTVPEGTLAPMEKVTVSTPSGSPVSATLDVCLQYDWGFGDCKAVAVQANAQPAALALGSGTWRVRAIPRDTAQAYGKREYIFTVSSAGLVTVTAGGTTVDTVAGAYPLRLNNANLSVHLTSNGSDLAFGESQTVDWHLQRWNETATQYDWYDDGGVVTDSATSYGYFGDAGKYRVIAVQHGFTDLSWGWSTPFWIRADGTVWADAAYTSAVTSAVTVEMAPANVRMHVVDPVSAQPLDAGVVIFKDGSTTPFLTAADLAPINKGDVGVHLTDGTYSVEVTPAPDSPYGMKIYSVTVAGESVSFSPTVALTQSGRAVLTVLAPNVAGTITGPAGSQIDYGSDGFIQVQLQQKNADGWYPPVENGDRVSKGSFGYFVPNDGDYQLAFTPHGIPTVGATVVRFVVKNGAVYEADGTTLKPTFGTAMPAPVAQFVAVDPRTQTPLPDALTWLYTSDNWTYLGSSQATVNAPGLFGIAAVPGTYKLYLYVAGNSSVFAGRMYDVTVTAQGIVTVRPENAQTALTADANGRFVVSPALVNARFAIVSAGAPTVHLGGEVMWCPVVNNVETGCSGGYELAGGMIAVSIADGDYNLRVAPWDVTQFGPAEYKAQVTNGQLTVTGLTQDANGVWLLPASETNVTGLLAAPNGALTLSAGQTVELRTLKFDQTSGTWQQIASRTQGAPAFALNMRTDGRYRLLAIPQGIGTMAAGHLDFTIYSSAAYADEAHTQLLGSLTVRLETPTATLRLTRPDNGSAVSGGSVNVYQLSPWLPVVDAYAGTTADGKVGLNLPAGSYRMFVNGPNLVNSQYDVTVDANANWAMTITDSTTVVLPVNGVFTVSPRIPNFKFLLVSPTDTATALQGDVQWCKVDNTNCVGWGVGAGGATWASIQDGDFLLKASPSSSTTYAQARYQVHVEAGVVTIAGLSAGVDQVWRLPAALANLSGRVMLNGAQLSVTANQSVNLELQKEVAGNWQWTGIYQNTQNGLFGIRVAESGHYRLSVRPNNLTDVSWSFSSDFWANDALQLSSTKDGTYSASLANFDTQLRTSNVKFTLINPNTNQPIAAGWVGIIRVESGSSYWYMNADANTGNGQSSAWMPDGTYNLEAQPSMWAPSNLGLARAMYTAVVSNNGATIVIKDAAGNAVSTSDGRFLLPVAKSSLTAKLYTPGGSPTAADGDIEYCQVDDSGSTSNCSSTGAGAGQPIALSLAPGTWRLRARPHTGDYDNGIYMAVVTAGGVTIKDAANNTVSPQGDGSYKLTFTSGSVKGAVRFDTTDTLTVGSGKNVLVEVQRWNASNQNWDGIDTYRWLDRPDFAFNLGVGQYRISARPYGFEDLGSVFSSTFYVCTAGGAAYAASGCTGSALASIPVTISSANVKLTVVDPRTQTALKYGWVNVYKIENNSTSWVGNSDLGPLGNGHASATLGDGTYGIEINASGSAATGLARGDYRLTVSNSGSTLVLCRGTSASCSGNALIPMGNDNRFTVSPAKANVTGRVTLADGTPYTTGNNIWLNIALQKYNAANGNWDWVSWFGIDSSGFFSITATDAGKYRLMLEPQGRASVSTTYSAEFDIADASTSVDFGSIKLRSPQLQVKVTEPSTSTALQWTGIELRQNDQWLGWYGTGVLGVASLNFDKPGTYTVTLYPQQVQIERGFTKRTYTVVVTETSPGTLTATISGKTAANGVYTLELGAATVQGVVVAPGSGVKIGNSQVTAVNAVTGEEMWQYSVNSSSSAGDGLGKWAMSLPAGKYTIYARAPWGTALYGNSLNLGTITVAADGTATLSGDLAAQSASSMTLTLRAPTWTGTVQDPDGLALANASVCLYNGTNWNCTNTDSSGAWALTGSTSFDASTVVEVGDNLNRFPRLRKQGAAAVGPLLHNSTGNTLRLPAPNLEITVTAGGAAAQNLWVNVERLNVTWLASNNTNALGKTSMYVDPSALGANVTLRIRVDVYGAYATAYATTVKDVTCTVVNDKCSLIVALNEPNVRAVVRNKNGETSANSWVELWKETSGGREWVSGANTDSNGRLSLYAPAPASGTQEYTLRVNPSWIDASASAREYRVVVDASGAITAVTQSVENGGAAVSTESLDVTRYSLRLSSPNVTGHVVAADGSTGVRDSNVVAINTVTGQWLWEKSMGSRASGDFGLNLPNGTYRVVAQQSWVRPDLSGSAQCSITVTASGVTGDSSCVTDGVLTLKLREPNVKFTLVDGSGNPVANANVGIGVGNWWSNVTSRSDGSVGLFIDGSAILALNSWMHAGDVITPWIWVDPPAGAGFVRWSCSAGTAKPLCADIDTLTAGSAYAGPTNLGNVTMLGSNTTITVIDPGTGNPVANSWVTVYAVTNNGWQFVGDGNTGSSGTVQLFVENPADTSTRYVIDVNPPWDNRSSYVWKRYGEGTPLTYAQLNNHSFALGAPNLKVMVKSSDGVVNKWGWINLEQYVTNGGQSYWSGLSGYSLDNLGATGAMLPASARLRIVATPNGVAGARTVCEFTTDANSDIISFTCDAGVLNGAKDELTITLAAGNVLGVVVSDTGAAVAGVIVVADADDGTRVTTATNDEGKYALMLDEGKVWKLTFLPPDTTGLQVKTVEGIHPSVASDLTQLQTVGLVK